MIERPPFKVYRTPNLKRPSLIVGWGQDAGNLGFRVIDYLNRKLEATELGEIEPLGFFSLGGVRVEDNVVQSPECKFYSDYKKDLLMLGSTPPDYEQYKFLNYVLDFAQESGELNELYILGGVVSLMAHTAPRRILSVVNRPELKEMLARYGLETNMSYQTPPDGRPTLSSFLLWIAKKRNIAGANLWTEVPFYFATVEDVKAVKRVLWFLSQRFNLDLDFRELDSEIERQSEKIRQLERQNPEISKFMEMLERGIMLSEDENERLTKLIIDFLGEGS